MAVPDLDRSRRLAFLLIDQETRALLTSFVRFLEPRIDGMLDTFYAHLGATPEVAAKFGGPDRIAHARRMQREHWLRRVFSGHFDEQYFAQACQIGRVHQRIGLEPRWYTAGYCLLLNRIAALVLEAYPDPAQAGPVLAAVNKAAFLDMDLATSVYIEANTAALISRELGSKAALFEKVVANVSTAAGGMEASAKVLSRNAEEAKQQADEVSASAQAVSANIQTVAAAAEELSVSIRQIARQVGASAQVTEQARAEADRTGAIVHGLTQAVGKVDRVVALIGSIAGETNLLALNATIEAANAGQAGRSFAVVAKEVKNLAIQAKQATDDVAGQIQAVQEATSRAVSVLGGIAATITEINDIATRIAGSIREQEASTLEIARNAQRAAEGTRQVTDIIGKVSETARSTERQAEAVLASARRLTQDSAELDVEVEKFVRQIRQQ